MKDYETDSFMFPMCRKGCTRPAPPASEWGGFGGGVACSLLKFVDRSTFSSVMGAEVRRNPELQKSTQAQGDA